MVLLYQNCGQNTDYRIKSRTNKQPSNPQAAPSTAPKEHSEAQKPKWIAQEGPTVLYISFYQNSANLVSSTMEEIATSHKANSDLFQYEPKEFPGAADEVACLVSSSGGMCGGTKEDRLSSISQHSSALDRISKIEKGAKYNASPLATFGSTQYDEKFVEKVREDKSSAINNLVACRTEALAMPDGPEKDAVLDAAQDALIREGNKTVDVLMEAKEKGGIGNYLKAQAAVNRVNPGLIGQAIDVWQNDKVAVVDANADMGSVYAKTRLEFNNDESIPLAARVSGEGEVRLKADPNTPYSTNAQITAFDRDEIPDPNGKDKGLVITDNREGQVPLNQKDSVLTWSVRPNQEEGVPNSERTTDIKVDGAHEDLYVKADVAVSHDENRHPINRVDGEIQGGMKDGMTIKIEYHPYEGNMKDAATALDQSWQDDQALEKAQQEAKDCFFCGDEKEALANAETRSEASTAMVILEVDKMEGQDRIDELTQQVEMRGGRLVESVNIPSDLNELSSAMTTAQQDHEAAIQKLERTQARMDAVFSQQMDSNIQKADRATAEYERLRSSSDRMELRVKQLEVNKIRLENAARDRVLQAVRQVRQEAQLVAGEEEDVCMKEDCDLLEAKFPLINVEAAELLKENHCSTIKAYFISTDTIIYQSQGREGCEKGAEIVAGFEMAGDKFMIQEKKEDMQFKQIAQFKLKNGETWTIRHLNLPFSILRELKIEQVDDYAKVSGSDPRFFPFRILEAIRVSNMPYARYLAGEQCKKDPKTCGIASKLIMDEVVQEQLLKHIEKYELEKNQNNNDESQLSE